MKIADSKTRSEYPLSEKKIIKKTIVNVLTYGIIFVIISAFIIASIASEGQININVSSLVTSIIAGLVVLTLISYLYQSWYFAVYFYELTPDYIQIKKGPITPTEITIPYERIQDVYIDQDLLDRFFGLYDVHVSSATAASGMEAHIDGVSKISAEAMRSRLLQIVKEKISKNHN